MRAAVLIASSLVFAWPAGAQTPPSAAPIIQATPPIVKLLSGGAEPRRPMRFKLAKGAKETVDLTMTMSVSMDVPDLGPQSIDTPPLTMSMDLAVTDVTPGGDIVLSLVITGAAMEGAQIPAGIMDPLKGLSAVMTISDRGVVKAVQFDESKMLDPATKKMMQASGFERMSAPMPDEPVGVGATWEVVQKIDSGGMSLDQKAIYEVVAMDASSTTLSVTLEQEAGPQQLAAPGLPPEIQASLVGLKGSGSGKLTLRDGSLMLDGDLAIKSEVTMDMQMAGQSQRMTTATAVKLTLAPRKR